MIHFFDAAVSLEKICSEIESAAEIDQRMLALFESSMETTTHEVDRRIKSIMYAEGQAEQARVMARKWQARAQRFEATAEWLNNQVKSVLGTVNVPLKGTLGSFKLVNNSKPSVTIHNESLVPDEFCQFKRSVNKEKLAEAIELGAQFDFASLRRDSHVRISLEK